MSLSLSLSALFNSASPADRPAWLADCGDGTYRNPVLFADYSDPDAIRVGEDYWLTASSFSQVPGLPILHSRDLVNWSLVNHALPRLVPDAHFSVPRHGCGVWAPSLRYHRGKFFIFYPDPDFGLYVTTADDPRARWSTPVLVKAGRGLIDPCPFWDNNGKAYLVHGWAKSRAGVCNRLTLHRLSPDGTRVLDDGSIIIDADQLPGWNTLEGPKLYKRAEYYYIFAPAGGVTHGYQAVFRAKHLFGPYEPRIVLEQGSTAINGPHQGAWVTTPTGEDWFLHFQDRGPFGRVMHLQPMQWNASGWPVMGLDPDASGKGEPVLCHPKPTGAQSPTTAPATSDNFSGPALGRQWQWQANPRDDWASLGIKPGTLRLSSVTRPVIGNLWFAPSLLLQKFPAPEFCVTTRLGFFPTGEHESAGLIVFGYDYAWLGLRGVPTKLQLVHSVCLRANDGGRETMVALDVTSNWIFLRLTVNAAAECQFHYSFDGTSFVPFGDTFTARESKWVGAKVGLFASAQDEGMSPGGYADIDSFSVTPLSA